MSKYRVGGVLLCLLFVGVALGAWPRPCHAEDSAFSLLPTKIVVDFPAGSLREDVQQLTVRTRHNASVDVVFEVEQYRLFTPEEIAEGKKYADLSWVTVSPDAFPVSAGQQISTNIVVKVPDDVPDGHYTCYVNVHTENQDEYVPVVMRLGSAIPVHEFGITPGYYALLVTERDEAGKRQSDELSITILNKGTAAGDYTIYAKLPGDPQTIDPDYEVGQVEWVEVLTPKVEVEPGMQGRAFFKVDIPRHVGNGKYKIWVGIRDTSDTSSVRVEYACKLLLTINEVETEYVGFVGWVKYTAWPWLKEYWFVLIPPWVIAVLLLAALAIILAARRDRKKKTKQRRPRAARGSGSGKGVRKHRKQKDEDDLSFLTEE